MNTNKIPEKINSNIYINFSNRLYLSVARQDVSDKLVYVYTLWCDTTKKGQLSLRQADTDIATFNKPESADLYMNTVKQIMRVQSTTWWEYSMEQSKYKKEIDAFNNAIKSICDNQKVK